MSVYVPTFVDHLARYVFATERCEGLVVDLGAKMGFGSQILSYAAKSIDVVDISASWLESAKRKNYSCPVDFIEFDFDKGFPTGNWDTAVAFEIIEHVEDPEEFVKNIADSLNEGGKLIFSVPHMVANKQHKTLFDEQKIRELIEKYFTLEEFYIQDKKIFSGKPLYKGLKCYLGVGRKIIK